MINLKKIKRITLSLMKIDSEINKKQKADYIRSSTASFNIPKDFLKKGEETIFLKELVDAMFEDLVSKTSDAVDSLGIWIEYNNHTFENAISLRTLEDIKQYSPDKNISPIYSFFEMTLSENDDYIGPVN